MISVDDLCHAAFLAANNPMANGKIYFVTDRRDYSTRQLYILMKQALGKHVPNWSIPLWVFKSLATIGDIGYAVIRRRLPFNSDAMDKLFGSAQYSSSRIKQDLGFEPRYHLENMLPQIIAAYRSQG